jgi:predicted nucleic acid-binding protein
VIVVDASAYVDAALGHGTTVLRDALAVSGHWVVPEHFRLEVTSATRRRWLAGSIERAIFEDVVGDLAVRDVDVWPTAPLLPRIRELAPNATPYDAAYLALAEELGCAVVTTDAKFARVPGITCRIVGWE